MLAVSQSFLAQLREPHVVLVEGDVVDSAGAGAVPLELVGGDVSGDRTAQVRRSCTLELAALTAAELTELPYGSYLDVRRGVRYGDATFELARLGLFRIDGVRSSNPDGSAVIAASDRMAQVRDEPLLSPYNATGLTPSAAIADLVTDVFPSIGVTITTTGEPTLVDVVYSGDRARAVAELAQSISAEAYFDADGDLVVAPAPDVSTAPAVWTIDAGYSGVLIDHDDARDRAGVANGVLVRGQADAAAPPLEVLVVDDDPGSPTLWGGPFGRVAVIIESTAVQSVGQATELAELELLKRLGLSRTLQITSAPNPALEPGDVVDLTFRDGSVERHVLDRVKVPLNAVGAVTLETRSTVTPAGPVGITRGREAWRQLAGAELVEAAA